MTEPTPYNQAPNLPAMPNHQPHAAQPHAAQPPTVPGHETAAVGLAMRNRHPVAAWLLWPFLTLGIYHLVWYYKIHKEMAEFDRRRAVPTAGPMLVLLLLGWTFIAPLVSYYNCGTRIRNAQRAAGLQSTCSPGVGMILMFVCGLGILYYQIELNKIADSYGAAEGQQVQLYV